MNRALHKLPFKMMTRKRIFGCVHPLDWFAAIDLKDAYFHVSILPRHRPFLRFAFEGRAYQYKVLPFGLSLSPRVFTKVAEAALVPLREQGVRILNYLDDWLILAQSREQLCAHRDLVLRHLRQLGLRVNWKKSKLVPTQRISFLGMELDSVNQTARLTQERAQSVLNCLKTLSGRTAVPLKLFQRLLGHIAAAAVIVPLGLLHMRPRQHWLHGRIPRWAWKRGTHKIFSPWSDPSFLRAGMPLEHVSRHAVVFTDALATGWGATYNGHTVLGVWTGPQLRWHINCLELLAVRLALSCLRGRLQGKEVLVRTDNTTTVAYINRQGALRSRRMSQLATPCVVPGRDAEVLGDLPQEVALTIASAQAPSTRRAYALKWNLFVKWCSSHREDPRRCSIRAVLSFLQQGLERRLPPSTLKVYVAAISAHHDPIEGRSVGKHDLVVRFLRGARRLNSPRPPSLPSWDLALVLRALQIAPFEPLQSVELKFLSMKTLLLTALASIKRVGDLQAFSVDKSCLEFGPADSSATLRPRPGYVPKVPTTPFRDQVVNLQALPLEEADPALALLCPVRALRQYVDRTRSFRTSEQLFVCYGGQQKGNAVSKQRMAHWIVDTITLPYEAQGVPCPLRLHAHSTRGVTSSWVLARGASLADICRAAGWATPNTFAKFYSLRVEPVSSCVRTSNG